MLPRALGVLGVAAGLCGCPDPNAIPVDDICSTPNSEGITSLTIGRGDLSELFVPLQDDGVIPMLTGGQGTDMLELRYRAEGEGIDCVDRTIEVRIPNGGPVLQSRDGPLRMYSQGDQTFVTDFDYTGTRAPRRALLEIVVSIGDQSDSVTGWLGSEYVGPSLLPPETTTVMVQVGRTVELEFVLSEASEDSVWLTSVLEAEPGIVEVGNGFNDDIYIGPGELRTTEELHGLATGVATYVIGLGAQYYAIDIIVVEPAS